MVDRIGSGPRTPLAACVLTLALTLALVGAGGCSRKSPADADAARGGATPHVDLTGVPLSSDLSPFLRGRGEGSGRIDQAGERKLALNDSLEIAIQRASTRRSAGDFLYGLWRAEPAGLLWIETATRYEYLLHRGDELEARLAALGDTVSAPAAHWFARDCREYGYGSRGEGYRRAAAHAGSLAPLDHAVAEQKVAMTEADGGEPLAAVQRLLPLVAPDGASGPRLRVREWYHITRYLHRADRLDDALHAAAKGLALADELASPSWHGRYLVLIASIRQERREAEAALDLLRHASEYARTQELPWLFLDATDRAAALAGSLGRPDLALEFDRRTLAHSLAMSDSLNVPRNLMNIANDLRLIGRLDSCLVYQEQARSWVEAYDDARNQAMLPMLEAEYYCQVGDYARVVELLSRAIDRASGASLAAEEVRLHIGLIRQQLELGRPELALRSVARLCQLRPAMHDQTPDQNLIADYETVTAEFHLGQGEYEVAAEALGRARSAVERRGGEGKRWNYHLVAGKLAQRRGDPESAVTEFDASLVAAETLGSPEQRAASRFQLGHCLLELGRFGPARDLFTATVGDGRFGASFRTRLSSLVFLGRTGNEQGRPDSALIHLARADSLVTPYTPADLMARLHFERARALRAVGRVAPAAEALRAARAELARADGAPTREFAIFTEHLRRELALEETDLLIDAGDDEAAMRLALAFLAADGTRPGDTAFQPRDWLAGKPGGTRLVVTLVGDRRSHAWHVGDGRVRHHDLPPRRELLRLSAPVLADYATPTRDTDPIAAARLTVAVLGPLAGGWTDGAALYVLADDVLQGLPWAGLATADGGRVLLDIGPVVELQLPPARPGLAGRSDGRLLAAGVNGTAGLPDDLAPLRHAEDEAATIAANWTAGPARACLGADASWSGLQAAGLASARIIHFASHAVVGGRGAALQLAGDAPGSSPTLAGIAAVPIVAELVYLSCCDGTRRRHVGAGTADLAGAFLAAGARGVIASSLRVDDASARDLAQAFYGELARDVEPASALRAAQQRVRAQQGRTHHPFHWAFSRLIESGRQDP
ncbi:MAG: CHAT domain-containing protein [bacterium]|nr:CHAT domain-containing protein [bacterium]